MEFAALLKNLLFDYTLRTVALGSATLGIVSGALGSFAVLRRQSLLGDGISHAALPGIALAFILTGSKESVVLLLGAGVAGWLGTLVIIGIVRNSRIEDESALGLVLSVFFGFGLVLITFIQKRPDASQAGLDTFLFGQAATLVESDLITMGALGAAALLLMGFFWKEFKLLSFDPDFGSALGFPMRVVDVLLTTLLVIAIVIGLQSVGVVLMSAMVVAPGAAARQWTDRLGVMVGLAALFGALAGVSGALVSSSVPRLSTGPTVVICVSGIVLISILLAPNRGLLWSWLREQANRRQLRVDAVLEDLYILAVKHGDIRRAHSIEVLRTMSIGHGGVDRSLKELVKEGLVSETGEGKWALTPEGFEAGRRLESSGDEER
ncbi:MAG: iron chelate uptake ABC transporter family permease subunit [Deltaproteobacteria bacterium]|nr:iron chelate uptake ABC transporter family permease subunit [Deltaproteobacteria bacterium]NIS77127.1 iron chelate uptake ABC transporter family permease subunit [Deltaproteobacteria bacterium]